MTIAWLICDEARLAWRSGLCLAGTGFSDDPEALVEEIVGESLGEG